LDSYGDPSCSGVFNSLGVPVATIDLSVGLLYSCPGVNQGRLVLSVDSHTYTQLIVIRFPH